MMKGGGRFSAFVIDGIDSALVQAIATDTDGGVGIAELPGQCATIWGPAWSTT